MSTSSIFNNYFQQNEDNIGEPMKKTNKNVIYEIIYKPNENKEEKKEKMKDLKYDKTFILNDEKEYEEDILRIFGKNFVKNNKKSCRIIYNNKIYELREYLEEIDNNYNREAEEIKIKLIIMNFIYNMSKMFYGCYHITSFSENPKIKSNVKLINSASNKFEIKEEVNEGIINDSISNSSIYKEHINQIDIYEGCNKTTSIISLIKGNEDSKFFSKSENIQIYSPKSPLKFNITDISYMFSGCISLISLPDISKWNISNIIYMQNMFKLCISLKSLPDISK